MHLGIIPSKRIENMQKDGMGWKVQLYGKGEPVAVGRLRGNLLFSKMLQSDVRNTSKQLEAAQNTGSMEAINMSKEPFVRKYLHLREEIWRDLFKLGFFPVASSLSKGIFMGAVAGLACFVFAYPGTIVRVLPDFTFNSKEAAGAFEEIVARTAGMGMVLKLVVDVAFFAYSSLKAQRLLERVGLGIGAPPESD